MAFAKLPRGLYPVMLTPFKADGSVDYECLAALSAWSASRRTPPPGPSLTSAPNALC